MAHTKAKSATKLGRDSAAKRLGLKKSHGELVKAGEIIIRQRGTKYYPGVNVGRGSDDTLFALKSGRVQFSNASKTSFDGSKKTIKKVSVLI